MMFAGEDPPMGREVKLGRQRLSVICRGPSAVVERSTEVWVPSASSEVPGLAASVFLGDLLKMQKSVLLVPCCSAMK